MTVKELILDLLEKDASEDDIFSKVSDEFPDISVDEFLEATKSASKAIELKAAVKSTKETQVIKADIEESVKSAVRSEVSAQMDEVLKAIPNPNYSKSIVNDYKSFLFTGENSIKNTEEVKKSIISVKKDDSSWRQEMRKLWEAGSAGDVSEVKKISSKFLEHSKLYDDDFKRKVLYGDTGGGAYATPDEFSDLVFVVAQADSYLFNNATKIPMASDKMYLLGAGDVDFTELATQATGYTEQTPNITQTSMSVVDATGVTFAHEDLIQDSNVDIINVIAMAYGRGLAKYLKRSTTVGNIATSGDKLNGVYSTSGIGSVAASNGIIDMQSILALTGAVDDAFLDGCYFEMNRKEFDQIRGLTDKSGNPLFFNLLSDDYKKWSLLGYPVRINNQMPATLDPTTGDRRSSANGGTGTTATILFGNPNQYQIGVKGGFAFKMSDQYRFPDRQRTFLGVIRWASTIVNTSAWARLTGITRVG